MKEGMQMTLEIMFEYFYDKYGTNFNWEMIFFDKVFVDELRNEIGQNHFLYKKKICAVAKRKDNDEALFVTLDAPHDRLKISGVEIRLRQLGRQLKLDRIHPHKFRRTMATRAIDKGMPIEQVQKILGHSQIDTTMQYAMVNQNNVKTSHQKYMS